MRPVASEGGNDELAEGISGPREVAGVKGADIGVGSAGECAVGLGGLVGGLHCSRKAGLSLSSDTRSLISTM